MRQGNRRRLRTSVAAAAFRYGMQVMPDEDILYLTLSRRRFRTGERGKTRDVLRRLSVRKPGNAFALVKLKGLEVR